MFIITGGGSGIGQALACSLANRNKKVLIIGRNIENLQDTAASSPFIEYLVADLSEQEGIESVVSHAQQFNLEGLVHNAGIIAPIIPMNSITYEEWRLSMATNVDAPLFLTQKLLPYLQNSRVLNIGSGVAHFPVPTWSAYCVSKAALYMLTRCWQVEQNNFAITSVMPGIIDTNMQKEIRHATYMDPDKKLFFQQLKNNQQLLSCATVAEFLVWLLLEVDVADYVAQEWDIYDTTHHHFWLKKPHFVPNWSE